MYAGGVVCNACWRNNFLPVFFFFFHFGNSSFPFEQPPLLALFSSSVNTTGAIATATATATAINSMMEIKRNMFVINKTLKRLRR